MAQRDNDRFLFIHVMKTGGTSFTDVLSANFKDYQQYPETCLMPDSGFMRRMEAYMYLPQLVADVNTLDGQLSMVRAHVPYAVRALLKQNFRVLTILRNPIDRTLSYLKHARKYHPENSDMDLEQIYEDSWLNASFIRNYQTKIFSMSTEEALVRNHLPSGAPELPSALELDKGQPLSEEIDTFRKLFPTRFVWGLFAPCTRTINVDSNRLSIAKENLAAVELVGVTEHYDRFLKQLADRYGWKIGDARHLHAGEQDTTISSEFRTRIAADNEFDMELYEYAISLTS